MPTITGVVQSEPGGIRGGRFPEIVDRAIFGARKQIDRTTALVRAGARGLERVPGDHPIFGLVVTSDPCPIANAGLAEFGTPSETPSLIVSVREFEHLTARKDAINILLGVFADEERRTRDLGQAIRDFPAERHPVPERAWRQIEFITKDRWRSSGFESGRSETACNLHLQRYAEDSALLKFEPLGDIVGLTCARHTPLTPS